ncbi:MAG: hypothetical protein ACLSAP_08970 [Oscillospiraceae bacterium]
MFTLSFDSVRDNTARLVLSGAKSTFLNGVKLPGASRLAGAFSRRGFRPTISISSRAAPVPAGISRQRANAAPPAVCGGAR